MPKAAVIMGSRSDLETMKEAITTLQDFGKKDEDKKE